MGWLLASSVKGDYIRLTLHTPTVIPPPPPAPQVHTLCVSHNGTLMLSIDEDGKALLI